MWHEPSCCPSPLPALGSPHPVDAQRREAIKGAYRALLRSWRDGANDRAAPGEGGESPEQVVARGTAALRTLELLVGSADADGPESGKSGGGHVCVVAHSRFNKLLISALCWGDVSRAAEVSQGNACVNVIDFAPLDAPGAPPPRMTHVDVCEHLGLRDRTSNVVMASGRRTDSDG